MRYACSHITFPYLHIYLHAYVHTLLTLVSCRVVSCLHLTVRIHSQGLAILCMARASSDMTIEAQCDWGNISMTEWQGGTFKTGSPTPLSDA